MLEIPETLRRNAIGVWGDRGADWLARLPMLVDEVLDVALLLEPRFR